ncbi:response regulator transcription factor [Anaerosporobacter sp.]|uniref:response regulator transcription factor n=1 Tax=Anaerosporobacter sp. TaxID=1872529 RepID=UPI00286FA430|nr:response regulator [Anaerosporobacter sp.]
MEIKYKYIVIEDEPLIRKNTIKKIEGLGLPLTLVGEASNGVDGILLIEKEMPNIVITDIRMPQCDGLEVARFISRKKPDIKVVILSGFDEFAYAKEAMRNQVHNYILKPVKAEELKDTLVEIVNHFDAKSQKIRTLYEKEHDLSQEEIYTLMVNYFKENYMQDISLSSLADSIGFSQEYLGKVFKKIACQSPSKYLTELRMNEAKQLLTQCIDLEVGKIGERVGYRDSFYFSRVFKANVGMTPSEYRLNGK